MGFVGSLGEPRQHAEAALSLSGLELSSMLALTHKP
jgi:hypothetical protein